MSNDNYIWGLAEAYVSGLMPEAEQTALRGRLATDPVFATEFNECVNLLRSLEGFGAYARYQDMLQDIRSKQAEQKVTPRTIPLRAHYLRTGAVAAGVALLTSLGSFWIYNHNAGKGSASQYKVLSRKLENIERSQSKLINDIKSKKDTPAPPPAQARYTGTGFAITNDGYFVTNYHVTDGADSVYIQNHEGRYFKAYVVDYDEATDIALLKVEKSSFRFGKTEVPYTIAPAKSPIGSRVFTLGFPEDDIVYSEGYISAKNGYQGDSMQYRLEIPADPGQSGGPVIDTKGNLVAVVAANSPQSEGTTYAVSSKAIIQLVKKLDKDLNIHLPRSNKLSKLSREEQIQRMEYYTCSVKVYKK
jgi:S1-C subfamily serine protease